jgi:hypothetical protein
MRISECIIHLAQPVLGKSRLSGAVTVGTTWLDYTFPDDPGDDIARDDLSGCRAGRRVLIPITNVTAVLIDPAAETGAHLP